mmetsp:Transcript_17687/g.40995  ORF Transcript_17687/g.40995 Transcript_17687/m.40995 type:complete len:129 (-) Transcript_17687:87-473(-)
MAANAVAASRTGASSGSNTTQERAYQVHTPGNRHEERPRCAGQSYIDDKGNLRYRNTSSETVEAEEGRATTWYDCMVGWFRPDRSSESAILSNANENQCPQTIETQPSTGENPDSEAMRERRLRRYAQ